MGINKLLLIEHFKKFIDLSNTIPNNDKIYLQNILLKLLLDSYKLYCEKNDHLKFVNLYHFLIYQTKDKSTFYELANIAIDIIKTENDWIDLIYFVSHTEASCQYTLILFDLIHQTKNINIIELFYKQFSNNWETLIKFIVEDRDINLAKYLVIIWTKIICCLYLYDWESLKIYSPYFKAQNYLFSFMVSNCDSKIDHIYTVLFYNTLSIEKLTLNKSDTYNQLIRTLCHGMWQNLYIEGHYLIGDKITYLKLFLKLVYKYIYKNNLDIKEINQFLKIYEALVVPNIEKLINLSVENDEHLIEMLYCLISIYKTVSEWKKIYHKHPRLGVTLEQSSLNCINPILLFNKFLTLVNFDSNLLLDYLTSNETATIFLLYLLAYLRCHINSFPEKLASGENEALMKNGETLKQFCELVIKESSKGTISYNIQPLVNLLNKIM